VSVTLHHVTRRYPGAKANAVDGIELDIPDGTLLCLLGPSGCGKTTTLRMIAGLDGVTSGSIGLGGRIVDDPAGGTFVGPEDRHLGLVFQHYALWPHMRAWKNVEFGLVQRGVRDRGERRRRVGEILERLSLTPYAERFPYELSGGQQQRVALARTLVTHPKTLLMDEPLSNLDAQLRADMRETIRSLHREFGCTTIFVTHDQAEAMELADQIAVMHRGRISQLGGPLEVYSTPATLDVATFIGAPAMNLLPGDHPLVRPYAGDAVTVGLRPEALRVTPVPRDNWTVRSAITTGVAWIHTLEKDGTRLTSHSTTYAGSAGTSVDIGFDPADLNRFDEAGTRL